MFKKILIGIDFSKASFAALMGGLSLARKCMARVEAVHVITFMEDVLHLSLPHTSYAEWKQLLHNRLEDIFPPALYPDSGREILFGQPLSQEILNYARNQGCDLIVVGAHGHSTVSDLLIGSGTQQLARLSEIPVMAVRDVEHAESRYQGFSRVLVPTDFSDVSRKALDLGIRFADFLKADLHLIHVVDLLAVQDLQKIYPASLAISHDSRINVDSVLGAMVEEKRMVGSVRKATLVGHPPAEILRYAEENEIDFIVMGTHGRKGWERVLLGSVLAGVLAKSKLPVISIH